MEKGNGKEVIEGYKREKNVLNNTFATVLNSRQ